MSSQLFTATGCARCKILKKFMQANEIGYEEFDIKAEGKSDFAKFYRANRKDIFRDENGVEFPVFSDGIEIRQGVSVILGYLLADDRLNGFIGRSRLHGEWLDGINVSEGDANDAKDLYTVLSHLKNNGLKIELFSDGRNPDVLEHILNKGLADRLIMEISHIPEDASQDLVQSLVCGTKFDDYSLYTPVSPRVDADGNIGFISPEQVADIAQFIETATGSKKHPFVIKPWQPDQETDPALGKVEPLPDSAMFKYRTMARRYMVMTEIEKKES